MTAAIAIAIAYGLVFALLAIAVWRVRRPRRPALEARITAARARATNPAVIDTEPGINLADLDACELMLNDPEFAAHCDRLWQAIRDEQQKGEQA